jgi:hypothetical protein
MARRLLSILLLGLAFGCHRSFSAAGPPVDAAPPDAAPGPEVVQIDNMAFEPGVWLPGTGAPPEERMLAHRIWEVLQQSPMFVDPRHHAAVPPNARVRRARVRVAYGVERVSREEAGKDQVMRAAVTLAVEWATGDDIDVDENVACDGALTPGEPENTLALHLLDCALERAAQGLVEKESLRRADPDAIMAALDSEDPSLRRLALALVGERHLVAAVPKLLEMLHSPDMLVRDGAIGALVVLRDRRAVKALTELAQFRDLDLMRRIVDAVGAIGGDDAHAYLELVASGHDVKGIRELAASALERMDRRADAGVRATQ